MGSEVSGEILFGTGLNWHSNQLYFIIFNETNAAAEIVCVDSLLFTGFKV